METPNTPAGKLTERLMAAISRRLPELPIHEYNAIYGAILTTLTEGAKEHSDERNMREAITRGSRINPRPGEWPPPMQGKLGAQ